MAPEVIEGPQVKEGAHPKTGDSIPLQKIQQATKLIDELMAKVEAGRKASSEASGGGLTQLYDELFDNQRIVSMVVVCPAAENQQESKVNEVRLKWMIFQLSEYLHDEIIEIVTSMQEIGTVHETCVYVRFPFYLACHVRSFSTGISAVSVGAHEFKSWICDDGRAVVPKAPPEIGQ